MSHHRGDPAPSRSDVDIATGVLVGLAGGTTEDAHVELLDVANRYHLSLFRLSRSLIALSSGEDVPPSTASDVARLHWEDLVRERDARPRPASLAGHPVGDGPATS